MSEKKIEYFDAEGKPIRITSYTVSCKKGEMMKEEIKYEYTTPDHTCDYIPVDHEVVKQYGEWIVKDSTYKWMDQLRYCPFCGGYLE